METGSLSLRERRWCKDLPLAAELGRSQGVQEVVDSRLSRLSDACRLFLSHGAVLGDEFDFEIVMATTALPSDVLLAAIEEARAARLIVQSDLGAKPEYAFVHELVRHSLYEKMSLSCRRDLHARAARAIEAAHQADLSWHLASLAMHYTKAGSAGDLQRAIDYSIRAAEAAYAVCAFEEAVFHWETALHLEDRRGGEARHRALLLEGIAEARMVMGVSPAEAAKCLERAVALYEEVGESNKAAQVHGKLVTLLALASPSTDVAHAQSHRRRAESLLREEPDEAALGELNIGRAIIAHSTFNTEEGLAASRQSMEIALRRGDVEMWCEAAAIHGHLLLASGQLKSAFCLLDDAVERAERLPGPKARFAAAWAHGFSSYLLLDPRGAERSFQTSITELATGDAALLHQVMSAHLGFVKACLGEFAQARDISTQTPHNFLQAQLGFFEGDWKRAEELLTQEVERSRQVHNAVLEFGASFWLARLHRVGNHLPQAEQVLRETSVIAQTPLRLPEEVTARAELALLYAEIGRLDDARLQLARCDQIMLGEEHWRGLKGCVVRAHAVVSAAEWRTEDADEHFHQAADIFARYYLPWEQAETLRLWGCHLANVGERNLGIVKLHAAAHIYRDRGFGESWIERLGVPATEDAHTAPANPRELSQPVFHQIGADRPRPQAAQSEIYSLVTTTDLALLATLTHDAIGHLMNAIDKAAKLSLPIDRIANAVEDAAATLTRHAKPGLKARTLTRAFNPATTVRGRKYNLKKGEKPVLTAEEARLLLASIDVTELSALRNATLSRVTRHRD